VDSDGLEETCIRWGRTLAPPAEYHCTIYMWRRCGLLSNYFNYLFYFTSRIYAIYANVHGRCSSGNWNRFIVRRRRTSSFHIMHERRCTVVYEKLATMCMRPNVMVTRRIFALKNWGRCPKQAGRVSICNEADVKFWGFLSSASSAKKRRGSPKSDRRRDQAAQCEKHPP